MAGSGNVCCGDEIWRVSYCPICPRGRLVMVSGEEMRKRHRGLHQTDARIERAQADGARQVLDRDDRLAEQYSHPGAVIPRRREVWIERERPIDATGTAFDIADDVRSEEHTSELQSRVDLVCRLLLEKKKIGAGLARRHQMTDKED